MARVFASSLLKIDKTVRIQYHWDRFRTNYFLSQYLFLSATYRTSASTSKMDDVIFLLGSWKTFLIVASKDNIPISPAQCHLTVSCLIKAIRTQLTSCESPNSKITTRYGHYDYFLVICLTYIIFTHLRSQMPLISSCQNSVVITVLSSF